MDKDILCGDGVDIASPLKTSNNEKNDGEVSVVSAPPLQRMIVWGPDGNPVPTAVPLLTKQSVEDLAVVALSLPYKVPPCPPVPSDTKASLTSEYKTALAKYEEEKEFEGMTNAEVMIVKLARAAAAGSMAATESMLDRVLGRPKQSVESKSVNFSYADILKEKAARASAMDVVVEVARRVEGAPDNPFAPGGELEGLM